jgi:hypothetical protein
MRRMVESGEDKVVEARLKWTGSQIEEQHLYSLTEEI